jgi:tRNA (uracil-5-)-methyltransferase TRM9
VNQETINQLIQVNFQFYQTFASSFSSTRYAVQPGVRQAVERYIHSGEPISLLDLGCGNGSFAHYLNKLGFTGNYTGLDFSSGLLDHCQMPSVSSGLATAFLSSDITQGGWETAFPGQTFDIITSLAVMHHIPSLALRCQIYRSIRLLLAPGGTFIHSNWLFMNSPKLKERVLPWETVNLTTADVEPGDYLLDWRAEEGQTGYRYVHLFDEHQLEEAAEMTGFTIKDLYLSDGRQGNLAIYQIWQAKKPST